MQTSSVVEHVQVDIALLLPHGDIEFLCLLLILYFQVMACSSLGLSRAGACYAFHQHVGMATDRQS